MRFVPALLVVASSLAACNPTCQSSCRRFYADAPDGCGAGPEGKPAAEAIDSCINICQDAMQITGEPVDPEDPRFNPLYVAPLNQQATLSNEQEAAAWMDCVWSFSDDECTSKLDDQYCVKIF
ncbi:MAG TPA: hypothetical protein PKA64_05355 [Myxococcota bacterium]|nr:hypothetical protein [Myxococcota bacterium]